MDHKANHRIICMIKFRYQHKFYNKYASKASDSFGDFLYLSYGSFCIYCGIKSQDIWGILDDDHKKSKDIVYVSQKSGIVRIDNYLYNKYYPCLTEEEYIIKQLIE